MSLTSSRMRAVNAVFDAGSFSRAARRLGLSQPAITQQVRGLENHFGVTLFERRGSKLMPTALCREFVAVTSQLHGIEAQALAVLRQNDALKGGELRIGLGNAMPGMALISAFHRLYPNIQIAVEMGNWASIIDAVVDQRVDVGVLPDVPSDNRFRRKVCVRQGVVAIVHPNHPLAREAILVEERDPRVNALGIKGVGEIGITGTAGAITNAVWHATGIRVREFPITLDRLLGP
jgi:LysR family transcriptional regulator, low CO2-responsive transcriptional regulator